MPCFFATSATGASIGFAQDRNPLSFGETTPSHGFLVARKPSPQVSRGPKIPGQVMCAIECDTNTPRSPVRYGALGHDPLVNAEADQNTLITCATHLLDPVSLHLPLLPHTVYRSLSALVFSHANPICHPPSKSFVKPSFQSVKS